MKNLLGILAAEPAPQDNAPVAPITPAGSVSRAPVAPVEAVAPPSVTADAVVQTTNISDLYEDAVNKGDPASMYSLTSRVKGTPYESVVRRSAEIMQKGAKEMEEIVAPVGQKGGINTPDGRIAAAQGYRTVADDPQKGRAFVEWLLGNPNWRNFVTGGTPKTILGFDTNGKQLEKTINELGQTISIVDSETGQKLNRQQVADRGGFLSSLDNALGFQRQKEISKFNTEAFNKSNAATQEYAARAPELKSMYGEMRQRLQNLYGADLTDDQRRAIGLFTNRNIGLSQTTSQGLNALAQKLDNKNVSLSRSEQQSLSAVLEKLGFQIGGNGSVLKKNGEAVTKSDLAQAQNTLTNGTEFERNFQQSKDDFLRSEVFKNLGGKEMENLGRVLDLQGMLEKAQLELSAKHGTLPFTINPKTYQLGDEFSRGEALALIGEYNQDVTTAYNQWRDRQLEAYRRRNAVPNAGELEAAFVKTDIYKNLRSEYANRNREILGRVGGAAPRVQETPGMQWSIDLGVGEAAKETPKSVRERTLPKAEAAKPAAPSVPRGYKKIGTTPQGKDVYQTPDGRRVVEQ